MVRQHKWPFGTCVGTAKGNKLLSQLEIPSTKTLYNLLWKGELSPTLFGLSEVLTRWKRGVPRVFRRHNGIIIETHPQEVIDRNTFGHWKSVIVSYRSGALNISFRLYKKGLSHNSHLAEIACQKS